MGTPNNGLFVAHVVKTSTEAMLANELWDACKDGADISVTLPFSGKVKLEWNSQLNYLGAAPKAKFCEAPSTEHTLENVVLLRGWRNGGFIWKPCVDAAHLKSELDRLSLGGD